MKFGNILIALSILGVVGVSSFQIGEKIGSGKPGGLPPLFSAFLNQVGKPETISPSSGDTGGNSSTISPFLSSSTPRSVFEKYSGFSPKNGFENNKYQPNIASTMSRGDSRIIFDKNHSVGVSNVFMSSSTVAPSYEKPWGKFESDFADPNFNSNDNKHEETNSVQTNFESLTVSTTPKSLLDQYKDLTKKMTKGNKKERLDAKGTHGSKSGGMLELMQNLIPMQFKRNQEEKVEMKEFVENKIKDKKYGKHGKSKKRSHKDKGKSKGRYGKKGKYNKKAASFGFTPTLAHKGFGLDGNKITLKHPNFKILSSLEDKNKTKSQHKILDYKVLKGESKKKSKKTRTFETLSEFRKSTMDKYKFKHQPEYMTKKKGAHSALWDQAQRAKVAPTEFLKPSPAVGKQLTDRKKQLMDKINHKKTRDNNGSNSLPSGLKLPDINSNPLSFSSDISKYGMSASF